MSAAMRMSSQDEQVVTTYLAAMQTVGRKTGQSTTQAARTCQARVTRAGGWDQLSSAQRIEIIGKARSFASWLMVTGRLVVDAEVISTLNLHLGHAAGSYCAEDHQWFPSLANESVSAASRSPRSGTSWPRSPR